MEWICNNTLFGDGSGQNAIFINGYLNICITEFFVIWIINMLGFFGSIGYYWWVLRRYFDYEGNQTKKNALWVNTSYGLKMLCCTVTAYQWLWTRGSYNYVTYPSVLSFTDITNMFVYLTFMAVLYAEHNRNIPHGNVVRIYFVITFIARVTNLSSLIGLQETHSSKLIKYYGNIGVPIILVIVQFIMAALMVLGLFERLREYLEPCKAQEIAETNQATFLEFLQLISAKGSHLGFSFLLLGVLVSVGKGALTVQRNMHEAILFSAVSTFDMESYLFEVAVVALIYAAEAVCVGTSFFLCGFASEKIIHGRNGIRKRLFASLLQQESAYHAQHSSGELSSRFTSDTENVRSFLSQRFPALGENLSIIIYGLIQMFIIDPIASTLMVGFIPLAFGLSYFQSKKLEAYVAEGQSQNAVVTEKVQDTFGKFQTVLVYGKRSLEKTVFSGLMEKTYSIFRGKVLFNSILSAINGLVTWNLQSIAFFLSLDLFKKSGGSDIQGILAFTNYSFNVVYAAILVLRIIPAFGEAMGAATAIIEIINRKPLYPEVPLHTNLVVTRGEIVFEDVHFTYPGATTETLHGISLVIKPGTKVAIVGDSGAGKSTIFGLIAKFYGIESGRILIDGQDIAHCDPKSIRSFIGSVSQDRDLFVASILENILYGKADPDNDHGQAMIDEILEGLKGDKSISGTASLILSDVMDAIKQANAQDFVKSRNDLAFMLGEGGAGLSGGQKQRVTIARALYKNPPILLLDEVTSALDQISEAVVQQALDKVAEKRTVLVVAHRLNTIRNSDMIVVMDKGNIIATGTHAELIQTSEKYVKMVTAAEREEEKVESQFVLELLSSLKAISNDIDEEDVETLRSLKKILSPLQRMELPEYKEIKIEETEAKPSGRKFGKAKGGDNYMNAQSMNEQLELQNFANTNEHGKRRSSLHVRLDGYDTDGSSSSHDDDSAGEESGLLLHK